MLFSLSITAQPDCSCEASSEKTVTTGDGLHVIITSGSENFSILLPAVADNTNRILHIKHSGTGTITIDPNASETIDGSATNTSMDTQYEHMKIYCDGSEWWIVGGVY